MSGGIPLIPAGFTDATLVCSETEPPHVDALTNATGVCPSHSFAFLFGTNHVASSTAEMNGQPIVLSLRRSVTRADPTGLDRVLGLPNTRFSVRLPSTTLLALELVLERSRTEMQKEKMRQQRTAEHRSSATPSEGYRPPNNAFLLAFRSVLRI